MRGGIFASLGLLTGMLLGIPSQAQIVPDGSTLTRVEGNTIVPIQTGTINGGNLFHSLNQFNVPPEGVAFGVGNTGINGATINNIITRVTGTTPSLIEGTIQSRGAFPNASLYILNPQGLLFGAGARLDVGGSFHGSSATGIGFERQQVFRVKGASDFPASEPVEFQFATDRPSAIFNQGILEVGAGRNLTLIGGSVLSEGTVTAPNGTVGLIAVAGGSRVEIRSPETTLGLTIVPGVFEAEIENPIFTLPQLARQLMPSVPPEANTLVVRPDGKVILVAENEGLNDRVLGSNQVETTGGFTLLSGDVSAKSIQAGTAQLTALSDLVLLVPQISTTGSLTLSSGNVTIVRDSLEFPSTLRTNGSLVVRGDGLVDILAVNHPESAVTVGGNLVFVSRRDILGDGFFAVGGRTLVEPSPEDTQDVSLSLFSDALSMPLPVLLQPSPRLIP